MFQSRFGSFFGSFFAFFKPFFRIDLKIFRGSFVLHACRPNNSIFGSDLSEAQWGTSSAFDNFRETLRREMAPRTSQKVFASLGRF